MTKVRLAGHAITPAAFEAIAAALPGNVGFENKRDVNGDWFIWLEPGILAKLKALRGPGESYSDVILRVAKGEEA
jgi:hypothetical protein